MSNFARMCLALGLVIIAVTVTLLWPDKPRPRAELPPSERTIEPSARTTPATTPASKPAPSSPDASPRELETSSVRAKREHLRAQILAAERARALYREPQLDPSTAGDQTPTVPSGEIKDRIGGHDALLAQLNADFMPLADECIEAALERNPELDGMLAVGLEVVTDEDLGGFVESVEFPEQNEVEDDELQTCIRETTLSMILPSADNAREQFMLTLPID